MPLETLIQASLNLVKSYQQMFWPRASKYPNSPEKQGIYSDSNHAMVSTGLILSGGGEKNALSVFYSQFQ